MKSAILAVGTELLFGKVVNTNAAYLSQELNNMGIDVIYHYTMGDNPDRLRRVLEFAMEDCDLVVCTGGLGPTEDDLTKETISRFFGKELVLNQPALDSMMKFFETLNIEFTENNLKQAYMPENSTVFQNGAGTAPGFAAEKNGKYIICMPGVPREMKHMFEHEVKPFLMKLSDAHIYSRSLKVFGLGESMVETRLLHLIDGQTDPTIATYAKEGEVEVRVTSKRATLDEARRAADEMANSVLEVIGSYVYSTEGGEIYEEVARKLMERKITVSCCESPTAGLFAASLAKVPGVSEIFDRGIVAYSAQSKVDELEFGLDSDAGTPYGEAAAEYMAQSLFKKTGSRMCIASTGVAGPDDVDGIKPGTYHISILFDGKQITKRFFHNGRTRQMNREFMTLTMFDMVNRVLEGKDLIDMW
ncbi:MAG: competence/damage-inducible protein A [Firmicutes bacterium]|nr:competence/damage-inducible protein A [Bacillota bacterium]